MAKGNHCNILKGNNIKTNNELISMTFFKKRKVITQNQSKEKTKQNSSKKKKIALTVKMMNIHS